MKTANRLFPAFLATFALVSACGADDEPTTEDYDDIATAMAPLVLGNTSDASSMNDALLMSTGDVPAGFTITATGSYQGARAGINFSYELTCRDGTGAAQTMCEATTDSAQVIVAWNGSVDTLRYDASISRSGDWTLAGLTGDLVTLSGNATFDVSSEFTALDGRTRTYMLAYSATYEGVQLDKTLPGLTGGRAVFSISAERTATNRFREVEASFSVEAEVTFTGTGATLVLDGERTYNLTVIGNTVDVDPAS